MKKLTLAEKREKLSLKKQKKKAKKPSQTELIQLQEYFQSRRYNDAKRLAEAITEKFPYHTYSFKILATILALQGRIAESVVIGEKVVSIDTHDADAYYNLGLAYQELGKLDKAEECYKAVVILKPKHADAHNNLGNTLHDRGKLQLAELHIKEAIAIKPDFTEAYNNLGLTLYESVSYTHLTLPTTPYV